MSTDFTYGGKQIVSGGPFKPNGKDMPSDARERVDCYADIANIPNPYVGLKITVKVDETNNNKMTDYIVKSLKANSIGVANSLIDEVVRYVDYLGVNTSGSSGEGLTSEQLSNIAKIPAIQSTVDALPNNYASKNHNHSEYASSSHRHNASEIDNLPSGGGTGLTSTQKQQLQTAYEHSQSVHVQASDIPSLDGYATETFVTSKIAEASLSGGEVDLSGYATKDDLKTKANTAHTHTTSDVTDLNLSNIDAASLNGKKFSYVMTKEEYDAIVDKDPNTIYLVDDNSDNVLEGLPSYSTSDANKVLAVNSDGTALAWVDGPTGSGSGLTTEQAEQLTAAYAHSQSTHISSSDIPTKVSQLENDSNFVTSVQLNDFINANTNTLTSPNGKKYKLIVSNDGVLSTEEILQYSNIIVSSNNISVYENNSTLLKIKLDQKPSNNQTVNLNVDNSYCSIDKNSLTFTTDDYNIYQEINIIGSEVDSNSTSIITLSSENVSDVIVNVNIVNTGAGIYTEYTGKTIAIDNSNLDTTRNIQIKEIKGNCDTTDINNINSIGVLNGESYNITIKSFNPDDRLIYDSKTIQSPIPLYGLTHRKYIDSSTIYANRLYNDNGNWYVERNIRYIDLSDIVEDDINAIEHNGMETNGFVYITITKNKFESKYDPYLFDAVDYARSTFGGIGNSVYMASNEAVAINGDETQHLQILLSEDRFNSDYSKAKAAEILSTGVVKLLYVIQTPEVINLNNSNDILLTTYANKTNIAIDSDLESLGIKALVPFIEV